MTNLETNRNPQIQYLDQNKWKGVGANRQRVAQTFNHLKSHTRFLIINPPFHPDLSNPDTCPYVSPCPHLYISNPAKFFPSLSNSFQFLLFNSHTRNFHNDNKMSPDLQKPSQESHSSDLHFNDTELTLGLPGATKSGTKRGFSDTVDLNLCSPCDADRASNSLDSDVSAESKPPPAKCVRVQL